MEEDRSRLTRASEPAAASIAPGATLGNYRVERLLGSGGMGSVYLAHDTTLHRLVALKVIDDADDEASRERLVREARSAAALNHPNVCTVYEVSAAAGTAFIAMEYVDGRPLDDRLADGPLAINEAIQLGLQAADALAYAHDHGVVHRDFKAANVIVSAEGRLKVVDFGLARRGDAMVAATTTMVSLVPSGAAAGTPYAMAPEQVRGETADERTDVWALGVLLHEMAGGTRPFATGNIPELFSSILRDPPAPLPDQVPVALRAVIERCLEKDPQRRYQRASEVRAALEAVQARQVPAWTALRYSLRRRWLVPAAAVLGLGILAVALNFGGVRDRLAGGSGPPIKLAVLPFQNLTGDSEQEYFSDGLTDEMITRLGRLNPQRLQVIARTSSMRYKKRDLAIDQIGRELGVDYVMEGSARREGSRIRISATLIQVSDQTQRWSDSFERDVTGILVLQSEIAGGIARALTLTLLPSEQARLASPRPVNIEAYEAYLKGRFQWQLMSPTTFDTAMSHFELAVQKDPNFAAAYTGIGTVWGLRCNNGVMRCRDALPKWKEAIFKARELDPNLPEVQAHVAAISYYVDWDWAGAEREFRRAIELDATFPDAHMWYADFLANVARRPDESVEEARRAAALDPRNPFYQVRLGVALVEAGRDDEAIALFQQVLKTDPAMRQASVNLTYAYARKGMDKEAFALMQRNAPNPAVAEAQRQAFGEGGFPRAARLRADTMVEQSQRTYVAPGAIGAAYIRAGEKELALQWLEKGLEEHETALVNLGAGRSWDPLRGDPRFEALRARMKFPN
jgi:serine/threonine-protein kinase